MWLVRLSLMPTGCLAPALPKRGSGSSLRERLRPSTGVPIRDEREIAPARAPDIFQGRISKTANGHPAGQGESVRRVAGPMLAREFAGVRHGAQRG